MLDSSLSFDDHVKYLNGKLYAKIKLLGRVRTLLDQSTALTVCKTSILPVVDYCDYIYEKLYFRIEKHCKSFKIVPSGVFSMLTDTHI